MSFAVGLGSSAVGYSLCAAYFLHGKKNWIYCHFFYDYFSCWLFSFELRTLSLSLSFAKEKSGIVVKKKGGRVKPQDGCFTGKGTQCRTQWSPKFPYSSHQ